MHVSVLYCFSTGGYCDAYVCVVLVGTVMYMSVLYWWVL